MDKKMTYYDDRATLKYSPANTKLRKLATSASMSPWLTDGRKVYSIDLLSGWSCPFADQCLSKVHLTGMGGRYLRDGTLTLFRCFSASQEAVFTSTYALRKQNFSILRHAKTTSAKVAHLEEALPRKIGVLRIHVSGDFFNQSYFNAILALARNHSNTLFYAYTKSLRYWLTARPQLRTLQNFVLTASEGGRDDDLIRRHRLRYSRVVYSTYAARKARLPLDFDDSHAADPRRKTQSFSLLIHGTQPRGSRAQAAVTRITR